MNLHPSISYIRLFFKKKFTFQLIALIFPIGITLVQYNRVGMGVGINSLLFEAFFSVLSLFPALFPILIIFLVSHLNAPEWLSDIKTWSVIKLGYRKYVKNKILFTLMIVCFYTFIGDLLSLVALGMTHGFTWNTNSSVIASGLTGMYSATTTMIILLLLQLIQAIGYALCTMWLMQYTKRLWETIVYPFLMTVVMPTLLFNLMVIPERFLPFTLSNDLFYDAVFTSSELLKLNFAIWGGLALIYALMIVISIQLKSKRGLAQ